MALSPVRGALLPGASSSEPVAPGLDYGEMGNGLETPKHTKSTISTPSFLTNSQSLTLVNYIFTYGIEL